MAAAAPSPGDNPAIYLLLGVGAWWFLTQRKATAGTATGARVASPYLVTPSRAGDSLQKQAVQAGLNSGILNSVLGKLFGNSSALQPSLVNDAARAAVRAGDSYYGGSSVSAPSFGTTGDFSRLDRAAGYGSDDGGSIVTAASRAAVRYGDSYYGSNDTAVANPIGSAGGYANDTAYSNDAAALNPAPGTSYTTEAFEYQEAPEIDSSFYDYG